MHLGQTFIFWLTVEDEKRQENKRRGGLYRTQFWETPFEYSSRYLWPPWLTESRIKEIIYKYYGDAGTLLEARQGKYFGSHSEDTLLHNGRISPQKSCTRNAFSEAHLENGANLTGFFSQKQKMQLASWNMSVPSSCQDLPEPPKIKISRTLKALTLLTSSGSLNF